MAYIFYGYNLFSLILSLSLSLACSLTSYSIFNGPNKKISINRSFFFMWCENRFSLTNLTFFSTVLRFCMLTERKVLVEKKERKEIIQPTQPTQHTVSVLRHENVFYLPSVLPNTESVCIKYHYNARIKRKRNSMVCI